MAPPETKKPEPEPGPKPEPGPEPEPEKAHPKKATPYHHGDLRRAILTAALDAITADGPAALSLRDLARRAGVSHAAPAHHFKDRTGLLTAIAAEGFGLLAGTLGEATDLKDAGVRYVRFAREHPAHFQVMFAPGLLRPGDLELTTARALATDALRTSVSAVRSEDFGIDTRLAGIAAWSLAHGFATLLLGHNLDGPVGDKDPEEVFRTLATTLFRAH
ncbi:TetR/AcrR family transcriptional regulator [Streptomyces fulvoviolaceus]|uniref:TetR/AcrR family transcriptional regulator n=1 Tax=Streptomyces fulvoviolaceus TaxID=285535 RepID=UPI001F3EDFC8|nr:TetR/AcrR family transcriptional regulator [Streptomyces fulvoviolaceus]MCT9080027.1 TetR/AcrR family transcriptional regulator [Streptomyces fulvoviolaceus]